MKNFAIPALDAPILITGSAGFIGKNLSTNLAARGYSNLLLFDKDVPQEQLEVFAREASFVFHLAGVNRPKDPSEFYLGNSGLTEQLISLLEKNNNLVPVLVTSSLQAGNESDYAKSKEKAESIVFDYSQKNNVPVYVYRLPGVFGKWCRPAYNSVVATFCHNTANGQALEVRDPDFKISLCYVDDVAASFVAKLEGEESFPAVQSFMQVQPVHDTTLGFLADTIQEFRDSRANLQVPNMQDVLTKKLYATYLSYLPEDEFSYKLKTNTDVRGSFTEFLRTPERGQVSVNISKPGVTKGNHWHNTKNEKFLVVSGNAVIRFRKIGTGQITEYNVSGDTLEVLDIPTGYAHNIENVGTTDLVTVMWANEAFDPENPDTIFEKV